MSKVYLTDIPAAIRAACLKVREGLFSVRDGNILLVTEPKQIDLEFEVIVTKDYLERLELSSRDGTTTTTTSGTTSETKTESAAISVTTGTSNMNYVRSGSESSHDSGTESGGSSGGQSGSSGDGGGELETYSYESDS